MTHKKRYIITSVCVLLVICCGIAVKFIFFNKGSTSASNKLTTGRNFATGKVFYHITISQLNFFDPVSKKKVPLKNRPNSKDGIESLIDNAHIVTEYDNKLYLSADISSEKYPGAIYTANIDDSTAKSL